MYNFAVLTDNFKITAYLIGCVGLGNNINMHIAVRFDYFEMLGKIDFTHYD